MIFNKELSFTTFNDAYQTYKNHYDKTIKLEDFLNATINGSCETYKIKDIISNPPENLSVARLLAKTPEDAYRDTSKETSRCDDNPRGNDVASVKYHMKSKNVSPIVIVRIGKREILLDGVHRLVAAKLSLKRVIIVYVIQLK
jgi:hypothetical protein